MTFLLIITPSNLFHCLCLVFLLFKTPKQGLFLTQKKYILTSFTHTLLLFFIKYTFFSFNVQKYFYIVRELTLADIEKQIATDVLHGVAPLLHFISDQEPHYSRACVLLGPSSGALNIHGLRKPLCNMETKSIHLLICR